MRWASGLLRALGRIPEIQVTSWQGPKRIRRGGPARKVLNLLLDEYWLEVGLPRHAARARAEALMMPVNLTSSHCPVPQVVTILDVNFLSVPGTYDRAYAAYARRRFAKSIATAQRITTPSEYSRTQIMLHLGADPSRIDVVHPGLDFPNPVDPGSSPLDPPYALYVGQTEPHKDLPTAIQAMKTLDDLGLDLAIVGQPGRDHANVLNLAARNRRVHVIGPVSDHDLEGWYAHAAVFVFPSLTEGFGYPPLEAMVRGIPVVAARAGSLPEVLGDAALYHEPGQADDLALQIRRALVDQELRQGLVQRGAERVRCYTWEASAERMAGVLSSAAGRALIREPTA